MGVYNTVRLLMVFVWEWENEIKVLERLIKEVLINERNLLGLISYICYFSH